MIRMELSPFFHPYHIWLFLDVQPEPQLPYLRWRQYLQVTELNLQRLQIKAREIYIREGMYYLSFHVNQW